MSLEREFADRVAKAALVKATEFFQPPPEWDIYLFELHNAPEWLQEAFPKRSSAGIRLSHNVMIARIIYDAERAESAADLWDSIGHEVAHLLMHETLRYSTGLKKRDEADAEHGFEVTTVRLARLFCRERPYPGDEEFAS